MKCLLDTNAYTAFKKGHDKTLGLVQGAEEVLMSLIVVGELLFGFRNGDRYLRNRRELDAFLAAPRIRTLTLTIATSDRYGMISESLRRKGRPLPQNDIWIAAQAFETGAEVISFDEHFGEIDGLSWSNPA